ncbi:MAG: hypothetical protein IJE70_07440 [Oscillospiraceae bacterium]|nr:hypothetical protein [Oscillospiraceae bacterium]MBQ6901999.1 hypothetical protein [Oscillospiraceae bacterium]
MFELIKSEVLRFAGENSFAYGVTPHWGPISREACLALRDCGMKVLWASLGEKSDYNGDPSSLPYGHAGRLLQNRQPETMLFLRKSRDFAIEKSICGYNHLSAEDGESTLSNFNTVVDKETGIHMKVFGKCSPINLLNDETFETDFVPLLDDEYLCIVSHEQYSYPDYYAYQPDHSARLLRACECAHKAGYEFFYIEELVK